MLKRIENAVFLAKVLPDVKGNLVREMTYPKTSASRWAGETKQFITIELTIIPRIEKIGSRTIRVGGRQRMRVIKNITEHKHRLDFLDILTDLEGYKETDKKGDSIYVTAEPTVPVDVDWAASGAAYSATTPKPYTGSDGSSYDRLNFFLLESEQTNEADPMEEFKRQCQYLGIPLAEAADDLDVNV